MCARTGYASQPEHAALKQLLDTPRADAESIMLDRFPVPRFVDCDQYGSQARFLLVKLNPSATHNNSMSAIGGGGDVIFTEDVSLAVFMEHLAKLSVSTSSWWYNEKGKGICRTLFETKEEIRNSVT